MEDAPTKHCGKCDRLRPYEAFNKNRNTKTGLSIWCRDCVKADHVERSKDPEFRARKCRNKQAWYKANAEYAKAQESKRPRDPDKRRADALNRLARKRSAEGSYTAQDVAHRLKWQGGKCAACRAVVSKYHVDHIQPLSKGGSNYPSNLQILCVSCNCSKHAKDPIDFMRSLGRLL